MNPACELCRGACCLGMRFPLSMFHSNDINRWYRLHGQEDAGMLYLDCPCSQLSGSGKCKIYEDRPQVCQMFPVGSKNCQRAALRKWGRNMAAKIMALAKQP